VSGRGRAKKAEELPSELVTIGISGLGNFPYHFVRVLIHDLVNIT
jgi:hypothetical protein